MKKINNSAVRVLAAVFMMTTVVFGGFSKSKKKNDGSSVQKQRIVAATSGGPAPFVTVDNSGKLTGYDIEVLTEIFSRLPRYEFSIQITEFPSIFTGIDAGLYQVGCNHFGYNKSRGEKYIFTDEYAFDPHALLVKQGNSEIKSFKDIGGHTTEVDSSSYNANLFETYNKQHPENPVKLIYVDNVNTYPVDVSAGKIDFYFFTTVSMKSQVKNAGIKGLQFIDVTKEELGAVGGPLLTLGNFFIVSKKNPQLAADMNKAYREALADGTIGTISGKYFEGKNIAPALADVEKAHEITDGK